MARFKPIQKGLMLLPVDFSQQIVPGSFEQAMCYLVDHELDLGSLRGRYKNDEQGASAYDPAVLLKIILLAYSRGLIGSRRIAAAYRQNVLFMAISGDSQPHFTTLAAFISELGHEVAKLFAQVLVVCDRQGLIGREMFAMDGVKLPSNASKAKSGRRADYQRQADKMEQVAQRMLDRHRETDTTPSDERQAEREARKLERLQKEAKQLRDWLATHPEDRKWPKGGARQSNLTDNESAKMATGKGVIQGYTGVAVVDEKHQIILEAQAHGTGSEQELLVPVAQALKPQMADQTALSADAGYHSEGGLKALAAEAIDAYIPDNDYRKRDERYQDQAAHKAKPDPLWDKRPQPATAQRFCPGDFRLAEDGSHCTCPAGKRLYSNGSNCTFNGYAAMKFRGAERDCMPCPLRIRCLRTPDKTKARQVAFIQGKRVGHESHTDRMKAKIDSPQGRAMITRRFATVEPVFGNLRHNKRLDRFTLRGRRKVDGQWKLYCLLHNIEKLAHHGLGR
ncbi:MAG: transposase [Methylococcus sp.]|nr:transposase [Methylococcus sp.]